MPSHSVRFETRDISGINPALWSLLIALAFFLPQLLFVLSLLFYFSLAFRFPPSFSPIPLSSQIFRAFSPSRSPPC